MDKSLGKSLPIASIPPDEPERKLFVTQPDADHKLMHLSIIVAAKNRHKRVQN